MRAGLMAVRAVAEKLREEGGIRRVGFFMYDSILRFPALNKSGDLEVLVVPDAKEEPVAALPAGKLCYDVGGEEGWGRLEALLDQAEKVKDLTPGPRSGARMSCAGAAAKAGLDCLRGGGGKLTVVACGRSKFGYGAMRDRENLNFYDDGEREAAMFTAVGGVLEGLGAEMQEEGVACEVFVVREPGDAKR